MTYFSGDFSWPLECRTSSLLQFAQFAQIVIVNLYSHSSRNRNLSLMILETQRDSLGIRLHAVEQGDGLLRSALLCISLEQIYVLVVILMIFQLQLAILILLSPVGNIQYNILSVGVKIKDLSQRFGAASLCFRSCHGLLLWSTPAVTNVTSFQSKL